MKPIINPVTENILIKTISNMPQSLVFHGENGVGLKTIADYVCKELSVIPYTVLPDKLGKIDLENGVISINSIRSIYDYVKTKDVNKKVIIIDYAERMTTQSQNAFLKLLEEPNPTTHFILLTHLINTLLPTILSRVEQIEIRNITNNQTTKFLDELGVIDNMKRTQLLFIADGRPAEITRLISDESYFRDRVNVIKDAKAFLQKSSYSKLLIAYRYKDDRQKALLLLDDALVILNQSISEKHDNNMLLTVDKILESYQSINSNCNIRLSLAKLALKI